ncbi:hypothetical protein BDR03DRAFT_595605 [Suillus americanus]|nr:hypothetical protein BDR03DRAFT_595605 [Suillus americanus]
MTPISNDSTWWRIISSNIDYSYLILASSAVLIYDWALTFGQEKQRWSLMTVLYMCVRYMGITYDIVNMLITLPSGSATDVVSDFTFYIIDWMGFVTAAILVITIARLHAMHQRSRKMLIFLVAVFLAVHVACIVIGTIDIMYFAEEKLVLPGVYLLGTVVNDGILEILVVVQLFVLGSRLIISIREHHAKLVSDSAAGTTLASIAFQERVHVSTSGGV